MPTNRNFENFPFDDISTSSYYNVPTLSIEVLRNQTSMFNTALEVVRRAGEMLKPDVETSNTKRPKKVPDKWQGNKTFRHKTFRQQDGGRRFGNKMLPKRLSPAVKTFRHQRRFGNKKNNL